MNIDSMESPTGLSIYHAGPPLKGGPMPSLFYFSLAGDESLTLDPYNQPVQFLSEYPIRVFSFTLPFHGPGLNPKIAVDLWREEVINGNDILTEFLDKAVDNVKFLCDQGYINETKIAVAGLSRGAFIATHLAARMPNIRYVLGFAPMTTLALANPDVHGLDLENLSDKLIDKQLRYYIGNRDVQVDTDKCYSFLRKVVEAQYQSGVRSPPVELIISPSIGLKGHGTSPSIFKEGANWLRESLLE